MDGLAIRSAAVQAASAGETNLDAPAPVQLEEERKKECYGQRLCGKFSSQPSSAVPMFAMNPVF